jgi:hypothetical protein
VGGRGVWKGEERLVLCFSLAKHQIYRARLHSSLEVVVGDCFSNSLLCKACLRCLWGREGRKGSERGVSQQLCEAHVAVG